MDNILTLRGVTKNYSKGGTPALDNATLELRPGRIVGLLGPNGSGKTTLLKLVAGLLTSDNGQIEVCGTPVGAQTKAMVSYLPDRTYLSNKQKVREQLDFFRTFMRTLTVPGQRLCSLILVSIPILVLAL